MAELSAIVVWGADVPGLLRRVVCGLWVILEIGQDAGVDGRDVTGEGSRVGIEVTHN